MPNRMYSYGYGFKNGELIIIENEANIVKRIFKEYINGNSLKNIARELSNDKIVFYLDSYDWNKSKVCRIIGNDKYIGGDGYPQIIDDEEFAYAVSIKNGKSAKKQHQSNDIEFLKNNVVCSQCGTNMRRISKWKTREKWMCKNGCKNDFYISDAVILQGINTIVYKIIENPEIFKTIVENNKYEPTKQIIRETNEINRILNEGSISFNVGKKIILNLASLKFSACKEDKLNLYTDIVINETKRVFALGDIDETYMKKVIDVIKVEKDGSIKVKFINGVEISNKEDYENG